MRGQRRDQRRAMHGDLIPLDQDMPAFALCYCHVMFR
jgi:hypothetical protein